MNREGGAARGGCGPRALHSGFGSSVLDPLTLPGTDGGNNAACPCFTAAQLELVLKRGDRPAPQPHGNPPQTRQRHSLPVSGTPVAPRPCAGPRSPTEDEQQHAQKILSRVWEASAPPDLQHSGHSSSGLTQARRGPTGAVSCALSPEGLLGTGTSCHAPQALLPSENTLLDHIPPFR